MTGPSTGGFVGMSKDPAEIEQRIGQWAQGLAEKAQRYQAAHVQAEQIRLTATSSDGAVQATVRADGSLTDLVFSERIRTMPLPSIASLVLSTMQRAQSEIAAKVGETMSEHLGDEDAETRAELLGNLRDRFPVPPPEDESTADDEAGQKWEAIESADEEQPKAGFAPPPAAPSPQTQRPAPRHRADDDEDDVDENSDPLRD
ncbi:YbaB/EbfC family nucleoid-associated protein [Actinoalloteichus hymeniacidonis]|uniref:YbaB/EbfC DNA-binding family protein n=1 Tax=Actinoalloteichus hymeniacidonis TaxID=340345 RepID=A0AAC9HS78_9PSEU|nr:YbaB/EbfC family nucleoid-associated protein [Actinoalloteichus hymeniacidonis]AOS64448.1 hypothetical protein TL08_18265 [Actinoalloteichus hymeniacidonis]MBB5907482.1 DNA-binding protein YbaB [Actinoalloteichus hymeniacidonis]